MLSDEIINNHGDSNIFDDYPELYTRGITPTQEFAKINLNTNQDAYLNLITGNLVYKRLDYYLYDIGIPIILEFTYNSGSTFKGYYGDQWQFSYNIRYITNNLNRNLILIENDDLSNVFEYIDSSYKSYYPAYHIDQTEKGILINHYNNNYFVDNDFIKYEFFSQRHHNITTLVDRSGNRVNFIYNIDNQLVAIHFASGQRVLLYYNDNLLTYINIPNYGDIKYYYDNLRNLTKVEYPNSDTITYRYNSDCHFLSEIINSSDTLNITYNNSLVERIHQSNSDIDYNINYDFVNRKNILVDKFHKTIEVDFDTLYRVKDYYKYGKLYKSIKWNEQNQIAEYTNSLGNIIKYTYNEQGLLYDYSESKDKHIQYEREPIYGRINHISINNSTINYTLDEKAQILKLSKDNEIKSTYSYDNAGQLTAYNNVVDNYQFLYDGFGNFKRLILNNDLEFSFEYNFHNDIVNISEIEQLNLTADYNYITKKVKVNNNYNHINKTIFWNSKHFIDSINYNKQYYIKYNYDNSNRLSSYYFDNLYRINFNYANDSLVIIHNPINTFAISYDFTNSIKEIKQNGSYKYRYDNLQRLVEESFNNKVLQKYEYNSSNLLKSILAANGATTNLDYDDFDRIIRIKLANNRQLEYLWDSYDRIIKFTDNDKTYNFNYHNDGYASRLPSGKLLSTTMNNNYMNLSYLGYNYQINYDRYGRTRSILQNDIELIKYEYINNLLTHLVINRYNDFKFIYNNFNKIETIINNQDTINTYFYDKYGNLIKSKVNGSETNFIYDSFNRIISINAPAYLNKSIILSYTNDEFLINWFNAEYKYNYLNNKLVSISNPNFDNLFINYIQHTLPNNIVAPNGIIASINYNNSNTISSISDGLANTTSFNYDGFGRLASLINKNSNSRTFKYNDDNKLIEYIDFDGTLKKLSYNNYFKVSNIILSPTDTIKYTYDKNLFLSNIRYFNGLGIDYISDDYGKLLKISDKVDSINYQYNLNGQLVASNFNNEHKVQYHYNNKRLIDKINYNDNFEFRLEYNMQNFLNKILLNDKIIANIGKDLAGNTTFQSIIGKASTTFNYNNLNLLIEENSNEKFIYYYDKIGRMIQKNNSKGEKENYEYNINSNLIHKNDFLNNTYDYVYDALGNNIKMTVNVLDSFNFTFNENSQLTFAKLFDTELLAIGYKNGLISDIGGLGRSKISFKWLNNYTTLLVSKQESIDSIIFDQSIRQIFNKIPYKYEKFGLVSSINTMRIDYDSSFRMIGNDLYNFDTITYNRAEYLPEQISYFDKLINLTFDINDKLSSLNLDNLTFNMYRNKFNNSYQFLMQSNLIYTYYEDYYRNFSYSIDGLKTIYGNKDIQDHIGFEGKLLNIDYTYNNLIRTISQNNSKLLEFSYDNFSNIMTSEDGVGNFVQYSYINNLLSEFNYSNGKFSKFAYDKQGRLIISTSNSMLEDSIKINVNKEKLNEYSIKYARLNSQIFFKNDSLIFQVDSKPFNLLRLNKNNHDIMIVIDGVEHNLTLDSLIVKSKFSLSLENKHFIKSQKLSALNYEYNIVDNLNLLGKLALTKVNSDTIIRNNYDILNRLSNSIGASELTFSYDDFSNLKKIINNQDTLTYNYSDNGITINSKKIELNANKTVSKIITSSDTISLFYDYADRLTQYNSKLQNIKLLYNSLGDLSAVIGADTSYIFNYKIDSILLKIVYNNQEKILDCYIFNLSNYSYPLIKYDVINKKIEYLLRNFSGIPVAIIKNDNSVEMIEKSDIFGMDSPQLKDYYFFYKDAIFLSKVNLFIKDDLVFDPQLFLNYNFYLQSNINKLSSLSPINLFNCSKNQAISDTVKFAISQEDLLYNYQFINNGFKNIVNDNRNKYIKNELENILNNFKVFNVGISLVQYKEKTIFELGNMGSYLPNLEQIKHSLNGELQFVPKLPQALLDSNLLQSLNNNSIDDYKFYFRGRNRIKQILSFLDLTELDTNFILVKKVKKLLNIYEYPTIIYPSNISELELFVAKNQDINKFNDINSLLRNIATSNNNNYDNDSLLLLSISNLFKSKPLTEHILVNQPFIFINRLNSSNNLINNFLPIKYEIVQNIQDDNLRRLVQLICTPFPHNRIPSQYLFQNSFIELPTTNFMNSNIFQQLIRKEVNIYK